MVLLNLRKARGAFIDVPPCDVCLARCTLTFPPPPSDLRKAASTPPQALASRASARSRTPYPLEKQSERPPDVHGRGEGEITAVSAAAQGA